MTLKFKMKKIYRNIGQRFSIVPVINVDSIKIEQKPPIHLKKKRSFTLGQYLAESELKQIKQYSFTSMNQFNHNDTFNISESKSILLDSEEIEVAQLHDFQLKEYSDILIKDFEEIRGRK